MRCINQSDCLIRNQFIKKCILLLKQLQDKDDLHDQDKVNKKTHQKRKSLLKSIKFNALLKLSSNALICYNKNLLNITCYTCNQKNYYFINCKDEKIKRRLKEFNVN